MKVEPPTSKQSSVTMEEIEDEDDIRMRSKARLSQSSPHIMEDDSDDDQVLLERMNYKEKKNTASVPKTPVQTSKGLDHIEVPISTKLKFEHPKAPEIEECSVPTLHSDSYKYKGPSQKEEVLLTVMDANLNELKEGEEQLPDLRKKWLELAAAIPTGAPPHLPPFRERRDTTFFNLGRLRTFELQFSADRHFYVIESFTRLHGSLWNTRRVLLLIIHMLK